MKLGRALFPEGPVSKSHCSYRLIAHLGYVGKGRKIEGRMRLPVWDLFWAMGDQGGGKIAKGSSKHVLSELWKPVDMVPREQH